MSGSGAAAMAVEGAGRELQMNIQCTELETRCATWAHLRFALRLLPVARQAVSQRAHRCRAPCWRSSHASTAFEVPRTSLSHPVIWRFDGQLSQVCVNERAATFADHDATPRPSPGEDCRIFTTLLGAVNHFGARAPPSRRGSLSAILSAPSATKPSTTAHAPPRRYSLLRSASRDAPRRRRVGPRQAHGEGVGRH